ncbi:helix-turn-helix transcriptional regulator [Deinococcus peraridilitoris]|uniref:Putative transcriptional regulator n=1 Tax=Deinococcus peraridilitoris (strain DSM 19664 / LMG 22246 / CIP 109416 / KR-200) TaxID=937777 RepID=L0A1U2_DEIPD|nr:YafY family protein [Deinococcus peraridilitoris]AFZ67873.1 putative transcriptional regulator [Deinococcus peraridilitoris DSM 19664]
MYDPSMRVLAVLELLQARERVTGPELARRLEVSSRTVQRYVARLQDLGIPVESTRGTGGAYRLRPGFRLPPMMFSEDEALALSLGLRALRHLGLGAFAPAAQGAGAKLERVLPRAVSEHVRDVEAATQLSDPVWTVEVAVEALVRAATAVRARREVTFAYRAHAGTAGQRVVQPYGLVHQDGRWFLVGRCQLRQALRTFRLDRVTNLEVQDATFQRPEDFDARAYLQATLPFAYTPHHVEVWLDMPLTQARSLLAPWRVTLQGERDGTRLRCTREHLEPFAAMLLGLGCDFTVHAPQELHTVFARLSARAARCAAGEGPEPGPAPVWTRGLPDVLS